MDQAVQSLLDRLDRLSDQFRELREGVEQVIKIADASPEMALTRARKVLEYVVRDVFERRIGESPKTKPLENLLHRLFSEGYLPRELDTYVYTVRTLGNDGTHKFGNTFQVAEVYRSLTNLLPILEWYFEVERPEALDGQPARTTPPQAAERRTTAKASATTPCLNVVPKGLRSFDAGDSKFFVDLLPGARDAEGLPESIRFWKHRIESDDETFAVGIIYGPSGCGKTSLVKAGLLPRLAGEVLSIYVEATADDTESRLLRGLRKRCPELKGDPGLVGTLTALRQCQGLPGDKKVLIVIDQFEQWLHAHRSEQDTQLAQALRQCDGEHVQCIVLVRDDFWMALTRFMENLHIELVQGKNMTVVDLFDPIHARKVLTAFGRAFGTLQDTNTKKQDAFLDQAIRGLAQDGRVICVQLAVFSEMVKGKRWVPATLNQLGGIEGIGLHFLEETFCSLTANPGHRMHDKAARQVLSALLPEGGSDIRGHMRSYGELLEVSGYRARPKDFDDLIAVLDCQLRLVTPTDPAGAEEDDQQPDGAKFRYYQLTHDYLVHSLREWLTRKQKETRRGRAELRLAERAASWSRKPENRYLPSLLEYLSIRLLTRAKTWNDAQQRVMKKAGRLYGLWALCLVILIVGGREIFRRYQANFLVRQLHALEIGNEWSIVGKLYPYRRWAVPLLLQEYEELQDRRTKLAKETWIVGTDDEKEWVAMHQAQTALVLNLLGTGDKVWLLLKHSPDPTPRSYLIHWLARVHDPRLSGDPQPIIDRLDVEPDVTVRRALLLALDGYNNYKVDLSQRQPLIDKLLTIYEQDSDPGIHGAAELVLRKLRKEDQVLQISKKVSVSEQQLQARKATDKRQWYVNTQGQTFVIIDGGEFWMGSSPREHDEVPHRVRINRRYALSAYEVTQEQFDHLRSKHPETQVETNASVVGKPQVYVSWYAAAAYCNWLSEAEGIPKDQWCYEPTAEGNYCEGMKAKEHFWELRGYRLPTEAEWEFACRAGTTTSRYYGSAESLLERYASYSSDGRGDLDYVGLKRPNDFGLFDMLGNAWEWCFDEYEDFQFLKQPDRVANDGPTTQPVKDARPRVLRGGAFNCPPEYVRSACRSFFRPNSDGSAVGADSRPNVSDADIGFRPARTYP